METRLFRGLSECPASRNIIFRLYRFSFHKPIKSRLVRGRLYLPLTTYKSTTESATLRPLNSGYTRFLKVYKYQQIAYTFYFINAILNPSQMYCSHSMTASFILSVFIHSKKSGISPHFSTIITTYLRRRTHDLTHKSIF